MPYKPFHQVAGVRKSPIGGNRFQGEGGPLQVVRGPVEAKTETELGETDSHQGMKLSMEGQSTDAAGGGGLGFGYLAACAQ